MTGQLLGCQLLARAFGTPSPLVETKLVCDSEANAPAKVTYEISFPDEGLPVGRKRDRPWWSMEATHNSELGRPSRQNLAPISSRLERTCVGMEAKPKSRVTSCGLPPEKFHRTGSRGSK